MGVIIFTQDEQQYRDGDYVDMGREMTTPPTARDTTFIYHTNKFTQKDVEYWLPLIGYRLVIVGKVPKMVSDVREQVIIDKTHGKKRDDFTRPIMGLFKWPNRVRVLNMIRNVPLALISAFLRRNRPKDMRLGRLIARSLYHLPDDYLYASMTYGIAPGGRVDWPKKKEKVYEVPLGYRSSDKYVDYILASSAEAANDLRRSEPEAMPAKMKKRIQKESEWI